MARGKKRVRKKRLAGTAKTVSKKSRKSAKRKLWSDESMLAAMEAVRKGTISINKAAVTACHVFYLASLYRYFFEDIVGYN